MNIAKLIFIAVMLCAQSTVVANQVKELSLEEKSSRSDLVVVGRIERTDASGGVERVALVHVETRLKGASQGLVKVRYRSGISELDPDCCEIGGRYIFFLREGRDGVYQSVNGYFGVYKVIQ